MDDILDLTKFPLDRPNGPDWLALVQRCQADLEHDGMFNLAGFLRDGVAEATVRQLLPLFDTSAFRHERDHNIYFKPSLPDLTPDHPALKRFHTSNDTLCLDQLGGTALERLYHWRPFAEFIAAVMGKDALYPMADKLAGVNAMSYREGQALNWHFDRSEFTTTLLLQAPDIGGEFEYVTDLRSDTDPNYDGVAKMLNGTGSAPQSLTLTPGTLNIFRGRNTAHRVTPVKGETARVIAVFSYFDRPEVHFTDAERIGFYGRAN